MLEELVCHLLNVLMPGIVLVGTRIAKFPQNLLLLAVKVFQDFDGDRGGLRFFGSLFI